MNNHKTTPGLGEILNAADKILNQQGFIKDDPPKASDLWDIPSEAYDAAEQLLQEQETGGKKEDQEDLPHLSEFLAWLKGITKEENTTTSDLYQYFIETVLNGPERTFTLQDMKDCWMHGFGAASLKGSSASRNEYFKQRFGIDITKKQ